MHAQLPENRTLEVWEGGRAAEIVYRMTEPPDRLCTEPNCRVYVDFEIQLGDYPRCRSGKPIVQAVLAGTDDACVQTTSGEDDSGQTQPENVDDEDSDDDTDDVIRVSCSSKTKTTGASDEDIDDDSTVNSRRITSKNWHVNQTVAVVAKLDFKYDGTQVRQLGVYLRKVNEHGETIERRGLARFTVSGFIAAFCPFYSSLSIQNYTDISLYDTC